MTNMTYTRKLVFGRYCWNPFMMLKNGIKINYRTLMKLVDMGFGYEALFDN